MAKNDADKPKLGVPSTAQVDLERRTADDYQGDAELASRRVFVNPNPLGDEEYIGTDPIYQNYANDTEKPYAAKAGTAFGKAEKEFKDSYSLDDADETQVVDDPGMGGKTTLATTDGPTVPDVQIGGEGVTHLNDPKEEDDDSVPPPPDTSLVPTPEVPSGQSGSGNPPNPGN